MTVTINKKSVTVSGITADDKTYDGNTTATLDYAGAAFGGKLDGDTLTVTATGTYDNADAGENKAVNITNPALGGDSAANYALASGGQQTTATAAINKATLTNVSAAQNGTLTYTGEAQTPEVTTTATAVNSQTVTFTYSKTENGEYGEMPSVTNVSDGGTFYYKASAPNHNTATGSFTVTVNKADPTYGQTLADVTLTNPDGNTAGTWAWADATTTGVGDAGNHTFKANFTPTDANNYNAVSNVVVTVTVGKANAVAATVTANDRTYDGTEQQLVTVAGEPTGGTMQYALGNATEATGDYKTSIPTATEVGT